MQLWVQGKSDIKVKPQIGDGRLLIVLDGKLEPVWKSEVQEYCDDHFWSVHSVWYRWKLLGMMPFSGGWAEIPAHITEAIEVAEVAYNEAAAKRQKNGSR